MPLSSLGDIQQIYNLLQQIDKLLREIDVNLERTERKSGQTAASLRQLESVAMRYILIARRVGLPEDADQMIQKVSMMIIAIRQLELTIVAAQAALAGAGPIGWAVLGASAGYTALTFYSLGSQ